MHFFLIKNLHNFVIIFSIMKIVRLVKLLKFDIYFNGFSFNKKYCRADKCRKI